MSQKIWLLTIDSLDKFNNQVTLRFSSGYYTDLMGNYYDDRIKQPALYSTSAYSGQILVSSSKLGFGETRLINTDGALDYLADYAVDGRLSILSIKNEDDSISEVIRGTVRELSFSEDEVSVILKDSQEVLNESHPTNEYLGNNILPDGLEGTEQDIKGRIKPKVYGKVRNAEPVLVNTSKLIYEVHDSTIRPAVLVDVVAVYDRGSMLTKHTHYTNLNDFLNAIVPAGHYATYLGYIKLGSRPDGTITCDVNSAFFLLGDVFDLLCIEAGVFFSGIDRTQMNSFGEVGIYLKEERTTSSMLDLLARSIGGYWYFEGNTIRFKQLVIPTNPSFEIQDFEIISILRERLGSGSNGVPIYKVKLKSDKIETVQNDLAGVVDDLYRARVSVQFRESVSENQSTKTRHPLSEEIEIETALRNLSSSDIQANRILSLVDSRRDFVSATVRLSKEQFDNLKIGNQVKLYSYKFGYSSGKNFVILGYTINAKLLRAELQLWG